MGHDTIFANNCHETTSFSSPAENSQENNQNVVLEGGRRKKKKVCKSNKEEEERQRMNHIAVEKNRRKMVNQHLAVLHSLMPECYIQRVCSSFLNNFKVLIFRK